MAVNKNFVVKNGLEVGGDTLFANSVIDRVGVGTTNPTSTFSVNGNTSLQDLSVSGVSTFTNSVAIGNTIPTSALTVVGSGTSTSQLYVTGVSTFRNNAYITDQNRLYFGDESLSISYQVVGITSANYIETFDHIPLNIITENLTVGASDGEIYANFKINSSVSLFYDNAKKFETSGLGVTVTGVTSTTYLYATGISTFIDGPVFVGSGTSTGTELQRLQVTGGGYFSSPVGIGITNPPNTLTVVGSGTSTSQLYVTGFSTFVGYSTFQDYVNIEDGLYVAGVSTFAGITTVTGTTLFSKQLNVSGVSTFFGNVTFKGSVFGDTIITDGSIYSPTGFTTFAINVARGVDFIDQGGLGKVRISGDQGVGNGRIGFYNSSNNLVSTWDTNLSNGSIDIYNYTNSGTQNITISAGSSVVLQHGGTNTKLQTIGTGVTVTGTTFTNQLSVSGIATVNENVTAQFYDIKDIGTIGYGGTFLTAYANSEFDIVTDTSVQGEFAPIWRFGVNGSLTLPGGTVATSSSISTPIPNDEFQDGDPFAIRIYRGSDQEYGSFVFENDRLVFPDSNGRIISGGGEWTLDTLNNILGFPSNDFISYDDNNGSGFDIFTFEKPIRITTAQTNVWAFSTDGTLTAPGLIDADRLSIAGISTLGIITSSSIYSTGIITSSGFVGDLTGNASTATYTPTAGIATNVNGGVASVTQLSVSGVSTFTGSARVGIDTSTGVILTSPNGTKYQLFVENDGTLKTVAI